MGAKYLIIISSGTSDATKVHVGVTNGFALLAGDPTNKVDFVLMAESGNIIDDSILRQVSCFGLPPMPVLLDDPVMKDPAMVSWSV